MKLSDRVLANILKPLWTPTRSYHKMNVFPKYMINLMMMRRRRRRSDYSPLKLYINISKHSSDVLTKESTPYIPKKSPKCLKIMLIM